MKYEVQITEADYVAAQWLAMRPRPWIRFAGYFICIGSAAILILCGVTWARTGSGLRDFLGLSFAFAYLGAFFLIWMPWRARRVYRQQKTLHAMLTYEFADEAFHASSSYGNSTIPWTDFHKWKEGKRMFLLYHSPVMFNIVPKRIFRSPEELENVKSLLVKGIGKANA